MAFDNVTTYDEALDACEDLIGALQDLHYRIKCVEDFEEYGVVESLLEHIEGVLSRYDSFD